MAKQAISLLVTTVRTILEVDIDFASRTATVNSLDMSRGVYFGLTKSIGDKALVVGRNVDTSGRSWLQQFPTDAIYEVPRSAPLGELVIAHDSLRICTKFG